MRITNHMIYGNALNNVFRNARHINNMVVQIETSKRIQRPSDDPLLSARTMRYRTILAENERFQVNAHSALAWMEVTESAFGNLVNGRDSLLWEMNDLLVRAAQTGSNDIDDHRAMIETLRQQFYQIGQIEMNQTIEGRYVFSGFHTDQPPVLVLNQPDATFRITQSFSRSDIVPTVAMQRFANTELPIMHDDTHILLLPYRDGIDYGTLSTAAPPAGTVATNISIAGFTVHARGLNNPYAYLPEPGFVHFIPETGELVFNQADLPNIPPSGIDVQYIRTGFNAGELNPVVYFESQQLAGSPPPLGTPTVTLTEDVRIPVASGGFAAGAIVPAGTPMPWDTIIGDYNVENQRVHFEFSNNLYVHINSFAKEVFTPQMFADLKRLIEFVDALDPSNPEIIRAHFINEGYTGDELDREVDAFMAGEKSRFAHLVHDRFNIMMERHSMHKSAIQTQHTNLGTRMARLDMLVHRLEEDNIHYTALLSDAEDVDTSGTILRLNAARNAFNDSLRATGIITQLSLANSINR